MPAPLRAAAALVLLAGSAAAQAGPAARIEGVLGERLNLSSFPAPDAPPAVDALAAPSAVPAGLWASLPAPGAATLSWLASRLPGSDPAAVRAITPAAADAIFAAAVARGMTPLQLFTDPGFTGPGRFYLPQAMIEDLFSRYEVRVLTPASGKTTDGRPYAMQALVIGAGRIDALYSLDQFQLDNPLFPDYTYKLAARVTETISGPSDLAIEGVWVRAGIVTPRISRIVQTSATEARVETNYGSRTKPVSPIRRR